MYTEVDLSQFDRSHFRTRFHLDDHDLRIIHRSGFSKLEAHAFELVSKRIAPAYPEHDGSQTPFTGHPVFKAQHATGTCCRLCLEKWHHIPQGQALNEEQIGLCVSYIMAWIRSKNIDSPTKQVSTTRKGPKQFQLNLFE